MDEVTRTTTQARQGVTGHGVHYVLAISLFGAWAAMSLLVLYYTLK